MIDSLIVAANAVVPFLCYLMLGYATRAAKVVDEAFLNKLTKMIFTVMFPCMTFYNIYKAESGNMPSVKLVVFCVTSILIVEVLLLYIIPKLVKENPRRGVIIQAIFRSNFVLFGLPLTISIFGEEKASVAAMMVTVVVSLYNVTSVIILEMFHGTGKTKLSELLIKLVKNPLLQGCAVGIVFYIAGWGLPECLANPIGAFSDMTSPLALFALGGTLQFKAIKKNVKYLAPAMATKLVILPLILLPIAYMIGLRDVELFLVITVFATPIASASYPMAMNMGGDGELAGQFVFLSTLISVFTLFVWIFALRQMGLIVTV